MDRDERDIWLLLGEVGAVLRDDHFVYTSGRHGEVYVNKDALYLNPDRVSDLCWDMADQCSDLEVAVVVAPAVGAVQLASWTAYHLGQLVRRTVLAAYADKHGDGTFVIKRGYDAVVRGSRVLVVEDIINTGGSVQRVVETVRAVGGEVVGVAAICNRGGHTAESLGVPSLEALTSLQLETWAEQDCPLCAKGVPVNIELGKGREFLAARGVF